MWNKIVVNFFLHILSLWVLMIFFSDFFFRSSKTTIQYEQEISLWHYFNEFKGNLLLLLKSEKKSKK